MLVVGACATTPAVKGTPSVICLRVGQKTSPFASRAGPPVGFPASCPDGDGGMPWNRVVPAVPPVFGKPSTLGTLAFLPAAAPLEHVQMFCLPSIETPFKLLVIPSCAE